MFQVTPNSHVASTFFPFTDVQYSPDPNSREIATCQVPAIMHLEVPSTLIGQRTDKTPKNVGVGRESYPADGSSFKIDAFKSDTNKRYQKWFGQGMVNFLWGKDELGRDTKVDIEQYQSDEQAAKAIGDHPTLSRIGYVISPRGVKLFYHDSMIVQMVHRMRELIEELGSGNPSVCFIGLGDMAPSNQAATSVSQAAGKAKRTSKTADTDNRYKVTRPSRAWNCGTLGWRGSRYTANGSIYIPLDYVPYSTMKRAAKYNHIVNQIGLEWIDAFSAVGIDWTDAKMDKAKGLAKISVKERLATMNLIFGSLPSFGHTDNPSPSDSMLDGSTISSVIRPYLTMPFTSAYTHMDAGILGGTKDYVDKTGNLKTSGDSIVIGSGASSVTLSPAEAMAYFIKMHFTWAVTMACMEGKWKLATYPAIWLYEGGPKPEHVAQRMMMNFRPDRDYGGGSSMPYTLIPRNLNPGETRARVPTLMYLAQETAKAGKSDEAGLPNQYFGPRDPVVITDVKTSQFYGERPETIIEEQFYYTSPVVTREGTTASTYRNYRTVNMVTLPRPSYFTPGATRLGFLFGLAAHHTPISGPVYEQPLLAPFYRVTSNLSRVIVRNAHYDSTNSVRLPADQTKDTPEQAAARQALGANTFDSAGAQSKPGLDKKDNPQNKAPQAVGKQNDLADIIRL
jgi:hypothetical protein